MFKKLKFSAINGPFAEYGNRVQKKKTTLLDGKRRSGTKRE